MSVPAAVDRIFHGKYGNSPVMVHSRLQAGRDHICRQQRPCRVMYQHKIRLASILKYVLQTMENGKLPVLPGQGKSSEFLFHIRSFQPSQNLLLPCRLCHDPNRVYPAVSGQSLYAVGNDGPAARFQVLLGDIRPQAPAGTAR